MDSNASECRHVAENEILTRLYECAYSIETLSKLLLDETVEEASSRSPHDTRNGAYCLLRIVGRDLMRNANQLAGGSE